MKKEYESDGVFTTVVDFLDSLGCEAVSEVEGTNNGYSIVYGLNEDGVAICRLVVEKKKTASLSQVLNARCIAHEDQRYAIVLMGAERKFSKDEMVDISDLIEKNRKKN